MANTPHDSNPDPVFPDQRPDRPEPEGRPADHDPRELPDPADFLAPDPAAEAVPAEAVSFDEAVPEADPASFTRGISFEELQDIAGPAAPAEDGEGGELPTDPEPIAPVAPVSGWFDPEEAPPPAVARSDSNLFAKAVGEAAEAPQAPGGQPAPVTESSDIFGASRVPQALAADASDVIAATAYGEAVPADPEPVVRDAGGDRPSEIALTFGQPPGGTTIEEPNNSDDLPIAQPVIAEADDLPTDPDAPAEPDPLFEDLPLADALLPDTEAEAVADEPDYGAAPVLTPDASSILADLIEPKESDSSDSSAVRLDAPGIGRTHSSHPDEATEFDLMIDNQDVPPELAAAAEEADRADAPTEQAPSGSDLFADARTVAELDLEDLAEPVFPIDPTLEAEEPSLTSAPSSIFSDKPTSPADSGQSDSAAPIGALPPTAPQESDSDSAVEFSDHPEAEDEATASRTFGAPSPGALPRTDAATEPISPVSPVSWVGQDDGGGPDWSLTADENEATISYRRDRIEPPPPETSPVDASARGDESQDENPSETDDVATPFGVSSGEEEASVEIDWLAGSSTEEPPLPSALTEPEEVEAVAAPAPTPTPAPTPPPPARRPVPREPQAEPPAEKTVPAAKKVSPARDKTAAEKARPAPAPTGRPRSGTTGWIGGTLLGIVLGGGAFAGAYLTNLLPKDQPVTQNDPSAGSAKRPPAGSASPAGAGEPTAADVIAALRSGDAARAKQLAAAVKEATPTAKAAEAEAALFALVQESARSDRPITADNPDLVAAREKLQAVVDAAAAATDPAAEQAAVKAAVRLAVTHELTGDLTAARKIYEDAKARFPKYAGVFEASLERLNATAPPAARPEGNTRRLAPADARQILLAVVLLQADTPAVEAEAGSFFWKAVNKAAALQFDEANSLLDKAKAAHLKQAKAHAGAGLNPLSDPLEQIFPRCCDELRAYWELRAALYSKKSVADAFKNGPAKAVDLLAAAQARAATAASLLVELNEATAKLDKANTDLKKAEADLDEAKKLISNLEKDVKAAVDDKAAVLKKLETEEKARKDADLARQKADEFLALLARELQTARLLGEKFDAAELLAAQKRAAERAAGPNLSTLLPAGMMAVGSGLSGAQLIDIAERLTRAEAATQAAAEKLAAETKRLTSEHAAELKKLADSHAAAVARLKDEQAAELKKAADAYSAESKKLTEAFQGKLKDLEAALVREKDRAAAAAEQFKRDLGNALSPSQALDLWLPLLVELRRPSDADPALAAAQKALAGAAPDSEDAAKARTVAGLALLYKNELAMAKAMFEAARSNPSYGPAAQARKPWALAAETGLNSVSDPLAAYRLKPELPKRDPVLATRQLDAGVRAYRAGRFAEAVAALTESTKADPTSPLAWYFLGAAKWAVGDRDAAQDDFRQGAVREKASDLPSRLLNAALAPIQGSARDALTLARP